MVPPDCQGRRAAGGSRAALVLWGLRASTESQERRAHQDTAYREKLVIPARTDSSALTGPEGRPEILAALGRLAFRAARATRVKKAQRGCQALLVNPGSPASTERRELPVIKGPRARTVLLGRRASTAATARWAPWGCRAGRA